MIYRFFSESGFVSRFYSQDIFQLIGRKPDGLKKFALEILVLKILSIRQKLLDKTVTPLFSFKKVFSHNEFVSHFSFPLARLRKGIPPTMAHNETKTLFVEM
jgi:hypothetical protein